MLVRFFATEAGRSQPVEFLDAMDSRDQAAQIMRDIRDRGQHGDRAPVSVRAIKGYRPLYEIRTGGYRTFCVDDGGTTWVLHICKKQDQRRGIEAARKRMEAILGG